MTTSTSAAATLAAGLSSGNPLGTQVNSFISGIFIKHVLENSPAGQNGTLKTGDRILAVNDIDLTQATHDRAVEVIRNAKSPVKFLIQSLIYVNTYTPTCDEDVLNQVENNNKQAAKPTSPPAVSDKNNQNNTNITTVINEPSSLISANLESYYNNENEITSPDNEKTLVDKSKQVIDEPNKYNYNIEALKEKYNYLLETSTANASEEIRAASLKNRLFIFKLKRNHASESLGLSLSGNVNLNKTSVFVCGIYQNSIAHRHGLIKVGDQILEINGQVIYGRAHSNVTPLIRNMKDLDVYLVILR